MAEVRSLKRFRSGGGGWAVNIFFSTKLTLLGLKKNFPVNDQLVYTLEKLC
jgi:hypothetical protein